MQLTDDERQAAIESAEHVLRCCGSWEGGRDGIAKASEGWDCAQHASRTLLRLLADDAPPAPAMDEVRAAMGVSCRGCNCEACILDRNRASAFLAAAPAVGALVRAAETKLRTEVSSAPHRESIDPLTDDECYIVACDDQATFDLRAALEQPALRAFAAGARAEGGSNEG